MPSGSPVRFRTGLAGAVLIVGLSALIPWSAARAEAAPMDPVSYFALYRELVVSGSADTRAERIDDLERLVAVDPDNTLTRLLLAETYLQLDRTGDAIDAFRELHRLGSWYPEFAAHMLARLYAGLGAREEMLAWLDTALAQRRPLGRLAGDDAFAPFHDDPEVRDRLGLPPPDLHGRNAEWEFDLSLLRREAHRMHIPFDGPAVPPAFDRELDALVARVPDLSDTEIWLEARRIVAAITDGHSYVGGPDGETPRDFDTRALPVTLFDFDDGLFVCDATDEYNELIGAQVLSLGGLDRDALIAGVDPWVQADNARTVRYIGAQLVLRRTAILTAMGVADENGDVTARLRMPDGEARTVVLPSGDFSVGRVPVVPPGVTDPPAYLRKVAETYWMEPLRDDAVYLQLNKMRNAEEGPSLRDFAAALHDRLASGSVRNVVIDVRHNNGGNAWLVEPLIRELVWFETADRRNRVFVITSHMSFSATQVFVARLERIGRPIFVGTPTGSSPNFVGEEDYAILPFSRLSVSFSRLYWQNSAPVDGRPWVEVAVPVPYRGSDYATGRDAALEAVRRVIETVPAAE
jgi:tetratricopeptide (TPR) repeat protein